MSTVSVTEDTGHHDFKPPVRFENTYQMGPTKKFPSAKVKNVIRDVIEGYLAEEKYEPELCRQMTKTLSEVCKRFCQSIFNTMYIVISLCFSVSMRPSICMSHGLFNIYFRL